MPGFFLISRKKMSFSLINNAYPLILASASPRRMELLTQIRLPFRVAPSHVDEEEIGDEPTAVCLRLAEKKAIHVHSPANPSWILGADTIVVIGDRVLGKPRDEADAGEMLSLLGGKEHAVITGFCILNPSGIVAHSEAVATAVRFKPLNEAEIAAYIQTGETFGKAGGYAIQGIGAFMVESISGSYTNVVGLPVCAVIKALRRLRALRKFPFSPP
jgi:septum formation protein